MHELVISFVLSEPPLAAELLDRPEQISRESLLLGFESEVTWSVEAGQHQVVLLKEVAILELAMELVRGVHALQTKSEWRIPSFYGTYELLVKRQGEAVSVREVFHDQEIEVTVNAFQNAASAFAEQVCSSILCRIPALARNRGFQEICAVLGRSVM